MLVAVSVREGHSCSGGESLVAVNNIFIGDVEYHSPSDKAVVYYEEGCSSLTLQESYGVIH
ncbi:MAG: hypothetical protein R6W91_05515, partial [Thermoplasmata archaeon]